MTTDTECKALQPDVLILNRSWVTLHITQHKHMQMEESAWALCGFQSEGQSFKIKIGREMCCLTTRDIQRRLMQQSFQLQAFSQWSHS